MNLCATRFKTIVVSRHSYFAAHTLSCIGNLGVVDIFRIVFYCMVLYCIVLYCIALRCIVMGTLLL